MNVTPPQIQIKTTNAQVTIEQPKGKQTITTTKPKAIMNSEKPHVIIDQYQCFAEAGLKNYLDLTKENAHFARQKVLEGIARIVDDGNRLAMIDKNMPPAIPELAEKNAWSNQKEFDIGTIPSSRPKIEVRGHLDINWEMGKVNIDYKVNKPIINYKRGKVEYSLKQKPRIDTRI